MKKDYPRPQFKRPNWTNLNGTWQFAFDDADRGLQEKWYENFPKAMRIEVPFAYQSKASGIHNREDHRILWYHRTFDLPEQIASYRYILNIGAIDYRADIFINGEHVRTNEGGHVSFTEDVTHLLSFSAKNTITLRICDDMHDIEIPRGKQYWKEESESIFYTRTSGIWQTIWLESVPATYIKRTKYIPDIQSNSIKIGYYIENMTGPAELETTIMFEDEIIASTTVAIHGDYHEAVHYLGKANDQDKNRFWTPETPHLYQVRFYLKTPQGTDTVESYFGMRKISVENGNVMLNNRPYYLRLVLDQGYYPESLLTSPDDAAIIQDIELTKTMGFNGVRKHQKIEEERYLYHADRLGLLVWEEMPSAYKFSSKTMRNLLDEWQRVIRRDFNHPSIIAWVPMNESWGVPNLLNSPREVHFLEAMYHLTKALDDTRMVISNDGWEHGTTDLLTIHDYAAEEDVLRKRYANLDTILKSLPGNRLLLNKGFNYNKQPILITEFGGICFKQSHQENGWGYSTARSPEDFLERLEAVFKPLYASPHVQGICYTQLTDVEQETNGLLTYERTPKVPLENIRAIVLSNQ